MIDPNDTPSNILDALYTLQRKPLAQQREHWPMVIELADAHPDSDVRSAARVCLSKLGAELRAQTMTALDKFWLAFLIAALVAGIAGMLWS